MRNWTMPQSGLSRERSGSEIAFGERRCAITPVVDGPSASSEPGPSTLPGRTPGDDAWLRRGHPAGMFRRQTKSGAAYRAAERIIISTGIGACVLLADSKRLRQ